MTPTGIKTSIDAVNAAIAAAELLRAENTAPLHDAVTLLRACHAFSTKPDTDTASALLTAIIGIKFECTGTRAPYGALCAYMRHVEHA